MGAPRIDLNADLGEGMGDDDAMLALITSANVACGGHAGDVETMYRTLCSAAANDVVVGAHPGYEDREHFGRRDLSMSSPEIGRMIVAQIGELQAVATQVPVEVRYVKLHGALAHLAARDVSVAEAVVSATTSLNPALPLLAISGTTLVRVAQDAGQTVYAEIFADRSYRSDGQLVPRSKPGALLHDPEKVADRMITAVSTGRLPHTEGDSLALEADSICVHGDTDGALSIASTLRERLIDAGVQIRSFIAR